jgi:hypothetical protein
MPSKTMEAMMPDPRRIEYSVGKTIHDQPVTLVWERDYMNRASWRLHRAEINQRDEPADIYGLTDDVILAMAEAVKSRLKGGGDGR